VPPEFFCALVHHFCGGFHAPAGAVPSFLQLNVKIIAIIPPILHLFFHF
jgi:hypothetical protein